ncbi:MAG: hypothetical protein B5766_04785 [Candidatus Lumbricidophila eiseniae]|uniref:Glycosyltransferase 2-like domain-containing protein n=1 Tax=Candidatus Lumbricidiphila eiseniae TaxID=1969409 RepID=A0A2A6FSD7_9MICO|nr:MAG: hypothetical protein B5766_04785 [Candidatus Lumbricidophila eiseniae]
MSSKNATSVAIITRTRDRALLLRRALDSVARQTFRDYHLVIVNDGGDPAAVDALVATHPDLSQVSVIHNPESVGRERAATVGIAGSTSEFIAILDDDDSWANDYLEVTVSWLRTHSDGAVAVRTEVVTEKVDADTIVEIGREMLKPSSYEVTLSDILHTNYVPPSSMLVRRDAYLSVGGWDGSKTANADWDFMLRLLRAHTVGFVDGPPRAFWHHRHSEDGPLGNSVFAAAHEHLQAEQVIRETYLKRALETGDPVGYLAFIAGLVKNLDTTVWQRLNIVADRLEQGDDHRYGSRLGEQIARIDQLLNRLDQNLDLLDRIREERARSPIRRIGHATRQLTSKLFGGVDPDATDPPRHRV